MWCSRPQTSLIFVIKAVFTLNSSSCVGYKCGTRQGTLWSIYETLKPCMSTPCHFLQYSPFTELCEQLAWGAFQILKALILTRSVKIHHLKLGFKVYEIDPSFMFCAFSKFYYFNIISPFTSHFNTMIQVNAVQGMLQFFNFCIVTSHNQEGYYYLEYFSGWFFLTELCLYIQIACTCPEYFTGLCLDSLSIAYFDKLF